MWREYTEGRASDDPAKRDLEWTCTICGAVLCDVQDGDTLAVLYDTAADHMAREHHAHPHGND